MKPIEHLREAIRLCIIDHLGSIDSKSLKVNFWNNPETIEVKIRCLPDKSEKVRRAFAECWILNRLKIGKMLTIESLEESSEPAQLKS